jgi:hypothetical protein
MTYAIGAILLAIVVANGMVAEKEDSETTICIGICASSESGSVKGMHYDYIQPELVEDADQ